MQLAAYMYSVELLGTYGVMIIVIFGSHEHCFLLSKDLNTCVYRGPNLGIIM